MTECIYSKGPKIRNFFDTFCLLKPHFGNFKMINNFRERSETGKLRNLDDHWFLTVPFLTSIVKMINTASLSHFIATASFSNFITTASLSHFTATASLSHFTATASFSHFITTASFSHFSKSKGLRNNYHKIEHPHKLSLNT